MGKGDKKSKQGKRFMGSYGVSRPRVKKAAPKTASKKKLAKKAERKAAPKKAAKKAAK